MPFRFRRIRASRVRFWPLHTGERPNITWRLQHELPNDSLAAARLAAAERSPEKSGCRQPEVVDERVEVAIAEQQAVPAFDAEGGNQAVDRLEDGDAVATKRAEVAR